MKTLEDLLKETDSLTYINALKVTLIEIKEEISTLDELHEYQKNSQEKLKKLVRRADTHYRLINRLVTKEAPLATNVDIHDEIEELELEELMQNE